MQLDTSTAERIARLETNVDHLRSEQSEHIKDNALSKKDTELSFGEIRSTFTEIRVQFSEMMGGFKRVDSRIDLLNHDVNAFKDDISKQLETITGQLTTVTKELDHFKMKMTYVVSGIILAGSMMWAVFGPSITNFVQKLF